ncbi:MAG TPA: hypothetical protein VJ933_04885 [Phaeodactylibacter sp.]|nr:hypothetical protein [Phaeodactylibacter sp.]
MVTAAQLEDWKAEWLALVPQNLGKALKAVDERLPADSPKATVLIQLQAQLNSANRDKLMGTRSSADLELAYNQIRAKLLEFIDGLEVEDFHPVQEKGFTPTARRGTLLHKIPGQMQVGKEEECIIRLAYDRAVIADNLELTEDVEVKEVTISEVMEAELIDPNFEPAFAIRSFNDERQFLQQGEYTEWRFYVRPLRAGTFDLLLKLTVIEEIDGQKERRNITWEEKVQIVTEQVDAPVAEFHTSGLSLAFSAVEGSRSGGTRSIDGDSTGSEAPRIDEDWETIQPTTLMKDEVLPPPQPAPTPAAPKKTNWVRRLSVAAMIVMAVGLGTWVLVGPMGSSAPEIETREPLEEVEEPSPVLPPTSREADRAWEEAQADGSDEALRQFIERYPDSPYAEEAKRMLEE